MEPLAAPVTHIEKVVHTAEDLTRLNVAKAMFMRYTKITLHINDVDPAVQTEWESAINRHYNACGCGEGKFFVFLGFAVYCVTLWKQQQFYVSWEHAGYAFLYAIAGAAIGKIYGKFRAYLKLKKMILKILSQLKQ